ncbi:unnamed protein product [Scytosiphon promiscuus]
MMFSDIVAVICPTGGRSVAAMGGLKALATAVAAAGTTNTNTNTIARATSSTSAAGTIAAVQWRPSHRLRCLSQAKRQILSKGLVSNGATVLDFSPGDGDGAAPASPSPPSAMEILMGAARGSAKRKRPNDGAAGGGSAAKGKVRRSHLFSSVAPTVVICDAPSFSSARARQDMEGIFRKYPLEGHASSAKVVGSAWLSGCLRVGSLQPTGPHVLDTVLPRGLFATSNGTLKAMCPPFASPSDVVGVSFQKRLNHPCTFSVTLRRPSFTFARLSPASVSSSSSSGSWGCLAPSSSKSSSPGTLQKEPTWRDSSGDDGNGSGGGEEGAGGRWEELSGGSVLRWVPKTTRASTHIVAFDMDGTLIKTKSDDGKRCFLFGDTPDDWQLWHSKVPEVMRRWHDRGYKVAIISNQMGVGSGKVDKRVLQAKVRSVVAALGIPTVEAYLSCLDDYNRKPRLGCWDFVSDSNNGGMKAEKEACLYVGDAAGRPKQGTYKKDFSAGDLKLALNAGIPFQTPEQFFMRSTQPLHRNRSLAVMGFDPTTLLKNASSGGMESLARDGGGLEVVVLVGPPGGGKSTLCMDRLPEHARINQDELSTLKKCQKAAIENLKKKKSVVVDATNPKRSTRAEWVALAQQHGASARCIFLTTPKEACFHLNAFRGCNPWSKEGDRRKVPDVVIHSWFKYLDTPQAAEGFSEVIRVPFTIRDAKDAGDGKGGGRAERELLLMHLLPK